MGITDLIGMAIQGITTLLNGNNQKVQSDNVLKQQLADVNVKLAELSTSLQSKEIDADIAVITAQSEINKVDAASNDKYQSRWRPTIGWVCALGLGYEFLLLPFIKSALAISILFGTQVTTVNGINAALPNLDLNTLMALVIPLLGLGAYRTVEKIKGK